MMGKFLPATTPRMIVAFHPIRVARDAAKAHVAELGQELSRLIKIEIIPVDVLIRLEDSSKDVFDARKYGDDLTQVLDDHDDAEQEVLDELLDQELNESIAIRVIVVLRELNNAKHVLYDWQAELMMLDRQLEQADRARRNRLAEVRYLSARPSSFNPNPNSLAHRFTCEREDDDPTDETPEEP
jgi:hypothetical protein